MRKRSILKSCAENRLMGPWSHRRKSFKRQGKIDGLVTRLRRGGTEKERKFEVRTSSRIGRNLGVLQGLSCGIACNEDRKPLEPRTRKRNETKTGE